jgi:aminopeptidase N
MYDVDGKRRYDTTIIYDRGGRVFWMLYDFLGHERAMLAYHDFFQTWSTSRDHPALQDFVAAMRPYAPDAAAYDAFVKQWFEEKVVPQYQVSDAKKSAQGDGFEVTCTVTNIGTGTMPVEVAATTGEREETRGRRTCRRLYHRPGLSRRPRQRDTRGRRSADHHHPV